MKIKLFYCNFAEQYNRAVCLLLAITLTVCLCGCTADAESTLTKDIAKFVMIHILGMDAASVEYQLDPSAFVLFYEDEDAEPVYLLLSDIDTYESQYPDCVSTWYRDQLTGEERTIYNAHLYAMEHCLKGFSLYVADNEKDFNHVRELLALDSPFLEQNINSDGEYIRIWEATEDGEQIYFHLDQFARKRWELKLQALEQCRQIVENIPAQHETQESKMLYLYHYVCDQITYTDYDDHSNQDYLYDAACLGKTVCDGYSNMLALLFNLIDVDTCEMMGSDIQLSADPTEEELDAYEGHTWVAAKIGENYYHFDPTYEDTTDGIQDERTIFFGVSDAMAPSKYIDYDSMCPACPDDSRDFAFVQLTMANTTEQNEIRNLVTLTDQRAKAKDYITYVLIDTVVNEDEMDRMLDQYIAEVSAIKTVGVTYLEVCGKTLMRVTTEPW